MKFYQHLKSLYYFSVVAEYLSIKKAAESLFVTQAAVSQQIRSLEDAMGASLFYRQHRALELTPEGAQLLPQLSRSFTAIEQAVNTLSQDNDPKTITLSVLPSFASRWLIPRLGHFYKAHPDISINLNMSDALTTFGPNGADIAIRFGKGDYPGIKSQLLMSDFIYPACHPHYAQQQTINQIDDLKQHRLLEDIASNLNWQYWLAQMAVDDRHLWPKATGYDGSHYVIDSALSAQGIAMVRHSLVAEAIKQNRLISVLKNPIELDASYFICAPEHHFGFEKIQKLNQWLMQCANEFSEKNPVKLKSLT